ncbi:THAP domain-containing protein 6-like [Amphiprion ocellaris]|uniref:THAP domain-containing protein 6-like n=1 Tax=Amphiprion ocellaris TaxID=80972 RepID=UPI000C307956|nr:THAP domain-containing protein 6-like [Amphiprion ocellaris]
MEHRFPRDKLKRQIWTVALRRRDFEPNDRSVVCSHHFKSEDFDRTGQTTRLREGVIPSVFIFTNQLHKAPSTSSSNHTSHRTTVEHLDVLDVQLAKDLDKSVSESPDHLYALDPVKVKERLTEAQEKLEELRRDLRNAKDQERRHKKTMKTLLKDLKQKRMLTEELQQKLDVVLVG